MAKWKATHPPPPDNGEQSADPMQRATPRSTCVRFQSRILPILLGAALIFMMLSGYFSLNDHRLEIDREAALYTDALAPVLAGLMWNMQKTELTSALTTISINPAMRRAEVYNSSGILFTAYGEPPSKDMFSTETPIDREIADGTTQQLGRLVVYYDYTQTMGHFKKHFMTQVTRLLLLLTIIFICGFFTYQRIIGRPLKLFLKAIRQTDAKGLPVMVQWEGNDEIGEVIHAHNRMIRNLVDKEAALADSEHRYHHLFDNALVGIFDIRQDGTFIDVNATVAEILGYPSVDALQQENVDRHFLETKDRLKLWETLLNKGSISDLRIQFRRTDNEIIWVELSGRLNPDGSFNGILQDVTAPRKAHQALKERDELHRAFFEENKAAMLLHDPQDSTIQFVNPAACHFYGYTEKEMTSMTIRDLDRMSDKEVFEELKKATKEKRKFFKQVHTLKNGAKRNVDVFTGPVSIGSRQLHYSIVHDVTEKRRLEAKLERMATRDQLTGTYNRHAFFEKGVDEIARAHRFKHPLAVLMFDLDHFKRVNDTHGHAIGDEVLRVFALRCRADLRQTDVFARLGGEEFAAILVETDEEMAQEVAERIRMTAETKPIPTEAGELIVTTSVGMASLKDEQTVAKLLQRADKGLYEAKTAGRNLVKRS